MTNPIISVYRNMSAAQKRLKLLLDDEDNLMESSFKSLARKRTKRIDDLEGQKINDLEVKLSYDAYLESLTYHWWDRADPYWFWDMK